MRKTRGILWIFLVIFLIIFVVLLINSENFLTGHITKNHAYTKAICNKSNVCQDYIIHCKGNELIEKVPIDGAIVKHSENWKDPRGDISEKKLCP